MRLEGSNHMTPAGTETQAARVKQPVLFVGLQLRSYVE